MAALKDILRKIGAVKKTKQITRAMNMVASAKLRTAQTRIERFRPYADKFYEMLRDVGGGADPSIHPLLETRDQIKTSCIILMTSDRGLCGSFNAHINQTALKLAEKKVEEGKDLKFICVGKKGRDRVKKNEYEIVAQYINEMNNFDFTLANTLGTQVINSYLAGEYDEVDMVFGNFKSLAVQAPEHAAILPLKAEVEEGEEEAGTESEYIYEPSVEGLLTELLPRYIKVLIYRGLLDTSASEHAARMKAMENATSNCNDMIQSLTLVYNKARQAAITRELMDIVGGAEALKK